MADKYEMRRDEELDRLFARIAPRNRSAYMRAAVFEKAARDEHHDELAGLRREVEDLRRQGARLAAEVQRLATEVQRLRDQ